MGYSVVLMIVTDEMDAWKRLESQGVAQSLTSVHRDSPRFNLVPGDVYNLTDADWKDIEIIREITMAFKLVQEKLEGEKYITSSLVVPIIKGMRSSAATERMFSGAGHIMNKKRANLSPDHMEELVYLHEVRLTVREWETVKRARH